MIRKSFAAGLFSGMQAYVPTFYGGDVDAGLKQMSAEIEAHRVAMGLDNEYAVSVADKPSGFERDWQRLGEDFYNAIARWEANRG